MKRALLLVLAMLLLTGCKGGTNPAAPKDAALQSPSPLPTETAAPTATPSPLSAAEDTVKEALLTDGADWEAVLAALSAVDASSFSAEEALSFARLKYVTEGKLKKENVYSLCDPLSPCGGFFNEALALNLRNAIGEITRSERKEALSLLCGETLSAEQELATAGLFMGEERYIETMEALSLLCESGNASLASLYENMQALKNCCRQDSLYALGQEAINGYLQQAQLLSGCDAMAGEMLSILEALMENEASAINAALTADPEAPNKSDPITFGNTEKDISFLLNTAEGPLAGYASAVIQTTEGLDYLTIRGGCRALLLNGEAYLVLQEGKTDLLSLAYEGFPGKSSLYSSWAREGKLPLYGEAAAQGYVSGYAIYACESLIPYLDAFNADTVAYIFHRDVYYAALEGAVSILVHCYGYDTEALIRYLKSWGLENYAEALYEAVLNDPYTSLTASLGYGCFCSLLNEALLEGCPEPESFLAAYLQAGPAPYSALKAYMQQLYANRG